MAYALHLITESSDHYTFAFDGEPTQEEVAEKVFERMGEEAEYICEVHSDSTFENKIDVAQGLRELGLEMDFC